MLQDEKLILRNTLLQRAASYAIFSGQTNILRELHDQTNMLSAIRSCFTRKVNFVQSCESAHVALIVVNYRYIFDRDQKRTRIARAFDKGTRYGSLYKLFFVDINE